MLLIGLDAVRFKGNGQLPVEAKSLRPDVEIELWVKSPSGKSGEKFSTFYCINRDAIRLNYLIYHTNSSHEVEEPEA